jgi:hypothetical protein
LGGAPPFRGRILATCKKREKMKLEVRIIGRKSKRTKLLISLNP